MPKIYDNINNFLSKGLNETIQLSVRGDFYVGYIDLIRWHELADQINIFSRIQVAENDSTQIRNCRFLVGI